MRLCGGGGGGWGRGGEGGGEGEGDGGGEGEGKGVGKGGDRDLSCFNQEQLADIGRHQTWMNDLHQIMNGYYTV